MKRIVQATLASAAAIVLLIAGLVGTSTASAKAATHRVHVTAVQLKELQSGHTFVFTEKDLIAGRLVGYDSVRCHYQPQHNTSYCNGAFARVRGLTYVHLKIDGEGHGTGKITGGTGAYKNATGTVKFVGVSQTRSRLTFAYTG